MEFSLTWNGRSNRIKLVGWGENGRVQELAVFMREKAGEME